MMYIWGKAASKKLMEMSKFWSIQEGLSNPNQCRTREGPLGDCPSLTTARARWVFPGGCSQKFLCKEKFDKTLAVKC